MSKGKRDLGRRKERSGTGRGDAKSPSGSHGGRGIDLVEDGSHPFRPTLHPPSARPFPTSPGDMRDRPDVRTSFYSQSANNFVTPVEISSFYVSPNWNSRPLSSRVEDYVVPSLSRPFTSPDPLTFHRRSSVVSIPLRTVSVPP